MSAFAPLYTVTGTNAGTLLASVTLAATAASQPIALPAGQGSNQVQITNQSAVWAYVNFGIAGAVPAATAAASYPVGPGLSSIVSVNSEVSGATCILASTTGNVTFTRGSGF